MTVKSSTRASLADDEGQGCLGLLISLDLRGVQSQSGNETKLTKTTLPMHGTESQDIINPVFWSLWTTNKEFKELCCCIDDSRWERQFERLEIIMLVGDIERFAGNIECLSLMVVQKDKPRYVLVGYCIVLPFYCVCVSAPIHVLGM